MVRLGHRQPRRDRHVAEQRHEAEQERPRGQQRHVAAHDVLGAGAEDRRERVRVQEQRHRRAECERGVRHLGVGCARNERTGLVALGERLRGGAEDVVPATELRRDVDDRHDHGGVDQRVLYDRDHRRSTQAARIRVGGQDRKGDDQRPLALDAQALEHHLDPHQLKRDVGHRGQQAGERNRGGEPAARVAPLDEVGGGHVAVLRGHGPEARHDEEGQREDQDRVRQREEPAGTDGPYQSRHRDEGVGREQVAAQQEPRDHRAEAPAAEAPFVQQCEVATLPSSGDETEHRHEQEQRAEDRNGDAVDLEAHVRRNLPVARLAAGSRERVIR